MHHIPPGITANPVGRIKIGFTALLALLCAGHSLLAAPALPVIPAGSFYVTNYGAIADGVFTNSAAFQAALDAASAAGGGTVEVTPPGVYLCGPLSMHSNTRFRINAGATVKLLPYLQYPGNPLISQSTPFIELDRHGSNFEICGPGLLDGQGKPWWDASLTASQRPYEIHMRDVSTFFLHDWNSTNPPMKHIVMDGNNDNITIKNATNRAPYLSPSQNTDCINLLGRNCLVQDCVLSGCDDNIAMGRSTGQCIDILITNITCGTGHGISFGSLLPVGGISNVTVIDCTFSGTDNGIRFKSDTNLANGCVLRDVRFFNIGMTNVRRPIIIYSYYNEYGSPDSITPTIASGMVVSPPGTDVPYWRDILISNVWGTASSNNKQVGIIWGRTEALVSNVTLQNINFTAPATFNVYNTRGVKFLDCKFTPSTGTFPTYTVYNADVIVTNTTPPGLRPITFDGLTVTTNQTSNSFALFNAQAGLSKTNLLSIAPQLAVGGTVLLITNHLNLTPPSALTFYLGTNNTLIGVRSNLALAGRFKIVDGGGFTNGTYILMTNGGAFTWNTPVLDSVPSGSTCAFDTNTPGQLKLVVGFTPPLTPPTILGEQWSSETGFQLSVSGPAGQTYQVLTSTNAALALSNWTILTTGSFPIAGPVVDSTATNEPGKFYRVISP